MLTRIFFATDLHGSETCFRKFLNAAKVYKANVLILGGDLTGKQVIPLVEQSDGIFKCRLVGREQVAHNLKELEKLEKIIRSNGYYPYRSDPIEMEELTRNATKVNELFLRLIKESLRQWVQLAEERLKNTEVSIYVAGGNDDTYEIDSILKSSDTIIDPDGMVVTIGENNEMISCSNSNMTPWRCPRDIPEDELFGKIDTIASQIKDMSKCIFNLHAPPYDTRLDTALEIDENLNPVLTGGQPRMVPVGSKAVRAAIEKYQPLLGLHGHIHESRGITKLGRTLCLNPGSEYGEGILRGVIVDLDEKGVKGYLFTCG